MTAGDLARVLLRRWYVVLAGLVLTLLAVYAVSHRPGVYWAEFDLILLAPVEDYYPNQIEDPPYELAPLAGLLVTEWNGSDSPLVTGSSDTTLFGEGVRDGVQVRSPNQGSQFRPLFTSPTIDVQVVGNNPDEVATRTRQVRERLIAMLEERQDAYGVTSRARVTAIASPDDPSVQYVTGSRTRAAAAAAVAGSTATILLAYGADRALVAVATRRRARSDRHRAASGVLDPEFVTH